MSTKNSHQCTVRRCAKPFISIQTGVIKTSTAAEQYEKRIAPIGRKRKNGKKVVKEIEYWGITAIVGRQRVKLKVVLRKISGSGKVFFWSVMKLSEACEKQHA